jgi:hypothetical protein
MTFLGERTAWNCGTKLLQGGHCPLRALREWFGGQCPTRKGFVRQLEQPTWFLGALSSHGRTLIGQRRAVRLRLGTSQADGLRVGPADDVRRYSAGRLPHPASAAHLNHAYVPSALTSRQTYCRKGPPSRKRWWRSASPGMASSAPPGWTRPGCSPRPSARCRAGSAWHRRKCFSAFVRSVGGRPVTTAGKGLPRSSPTAFCGACSPSSSTQRVIGKRSVWPWPQAATWIQPPP